MDYPIKFEICPLCGSESRILETETQLLISSGDLAVGTKIPAMISNTALFNPPSTHILARKEVPVLTGFYDVCADCGMVYCVEMHKGAALVEPQIQRDNHGGLGGMPFMGKG